MQALIQSLPVHNNPTDQLCGSVMKLLTSMLLGITWHSKHTCCDGVDDPGVSSCTICELTSVWFQLSTRLIQFFTPESDYPIPVQDLPSIDDSEKAEHSVDGKIW